MPYFFSLDFVVLQIGGKQYHLPVYDSDLCTYVSAGEHIERKNRRRDRHNTILVHVSWYQLSLYVYFGHMAFAWCWLEKGLFFLYCATNSFICPLSMFKIVQLLYVIVTFHTDISLVHLS